MFAKNSSMTQGQSCSRTFSWSHFLGSRLNEGECGCGSQRKAEEMWLEVDHAFSYREYGDKTIDVLFEAFEILVVYL